MPLFIFTTGLFTKKIVKYKDIFIKKILFYFFLLFFMKVMLFVVGNHFNLYCNFELFSGSEDFWYLGAVIVYMLLVTIINKIDYRFLLCFSVIMGLFSGYDNEINDFLYLSRIIVFFPFFLMGYYLSNKKEKLIHICDNVILKVLSFVILIFFVYICFYKLKYIYKFRMLFTARNPYSYYTEFMCTYKHRSFTYLISFFVGFSVMCLIPNRRIVIVSSSGSRTLAVYIFHKVVIFLAKGLGLFDYLLFLFGDYFIYVYILIGIIITLFFSLNIFKRSLNCIENKLFI